MGCHFFGDNHFHGNIWFGYRGLCVESLSTHRHSIDGMSAYLSLSVFILSRCDHQHRWNPTQKSLSFPGYKNQHVDITCKFFTTTNMGYYPHNRMSKVWVLNILQFSWYFRKNRSQLNQNKAQQVSNRFHYLDVLWMTDGCHYDDKLL